MKKYFPIKLLFFLLLSNHTFSQAYTYMGTYNNLGVPNYLETRDIVSNTFVDRIKSSLPEGFPVPSYNPQYIVSGTQTNIEVLEAADVWITFVLEGAGYYNTLGFYTYNLNNPPTTPPSASQINIIFPNVSALNSGGGLVAGDKVKLGTFPPGTGIGFVLLANAWNTSTRLVGNGLWKLYSNYLLNPETNINLKYHNVLLLDPETQRIVIGFEDIRRDNNSCDNDFNDAVFYISANPITAINLTNINETSEPGARISSGNTGGLESNGSLAQKIAKRNVTKELTTTKKSLDNPKSLAKFNISNISSDLQRYIPEYGFDSTLSYLSTPTDLLQITNAVDVLSVDYFMGTERKSVCLVTKTLQSVYLHTKSICDRVGGASLEKTNLINIKGEYPATLISLKREDGTLEYAISFSFQKISTNNYKYNCHWNISDFPSNSEYLNFQIWGSKPADVFYLSEQIIDRIKSNHTLDSESLFTSPPNILLKSGFYNQGKININITNKPKVSGLIKIWGTYREDENGASKNYIDTLSVTNLLNQTFEINQNGIFDAGLNIQKIGNSDFDSFYLADGAWIDNYEINNVSNTALNIYPQTRINQGNSEKYWVERGVTATGNVRNYYSIHRPLRLGLKPIDLTAYSFLHFTANGSNSVEIVLSKASISEWSQQSRIWIPITNVTKNYYINLNDFKDSSNQPINLSDINAITFSVVSDNVNFIPFDIKLNNIAFSKTGNCDANKTILANTYTKELYESSAYLNVQNKNNVNSNIIYTSSNAIEFKPGFVAEAGSVIKAEIKGCQE
jgi:hypothetical protein